MSKETIEKNPFDAFDILKGNFVHETEEDDNEQEVDLKVDNDKKIKDNKVSKKQQEDSQELDEEIEETEYSEETVDTTKTDNKDKKSNKKEDVAEVHSNGFLDAIKDLREKGILDIESDDIEDSEEGFEKSIQETINNRIKKHVASFGEEANDFLGFIEAGGNPKEFINLYYGNQTWEDYEIDEESNQKVAVRASLQLAGETPEDIEDMITEWEENGTLEKRAKSALTKLVKNESEQKTAMLQAQKQKAEQEKQENIKYWEDFKSDLYKKEDIQGFKVTPKVKDNLWGFMTQVDRKTGKTAYQTAVESNKDSSLLFALLAMNKFDITSLEKIVASKAASKVAGILKNYSPSSKERISGGRTHVDEGEDPFELFNKLK